MASEWREKTLGEFVRLQRGHDLTASEQLPGPIPIMGSAGQNGFHSKATTNGPGVVIGRSGASAGKVHYCPIDFWAHNTVLYEPVAQPGDIKFVNQTRASIEPKASLTHQM
jgi:type I restriction enzyme S subunit